MHGSLCDRQRTQGSIAIGVSWGPASRRVILRCVYAIRLFRDANPLTPESDAGG